MRSNNDLRRKILDELVINETLEKEYLDKYLGLIKKFIRIDREGNIILQTLEISDKYKITLYLIGAIYAKYAELRDTEHVTNKELIDNLGMKKGTVEGRLTELRKDNWVVQISRGVHKINIIKLQEIVTKIEENLNE